jgi:hypothetical protein
MTTNSSKRKKRLQIHDYRNPIIQTEIDMELFCGLIIKRLLMILMISASAQQQVNPMSGSLLI